MSGSARAVHDGLARLTDQLAALEKGIHRTTDAVTLTLRAHGHLRPAQHLQAEATEQFNEFRAAVEHLRILSRRADVEETLLQQRVADLEVELAAWRRTQGDRTPRERPAATAEAAEQPWIGDLASPAILIALGIFALVASSWMAAERASGTPSPSPAAQASGDWHVVATTLLAEYEADREAANRKYGAGVIRVTGRVKEIGTDLTNTHYLMLGEHLKRRRGVQVLIRDPVIWPQALRMGDRVTVRCRETSGRIVMNVILRGCTLESVGD